MSLQYPYWFPMSSLPCYISIVKIAWFVVWAKGGSLFPHHRRNPTGGLTRKNHPLGIFLPSTGDPKTLLHSVASAVMSTLLKYWEWGLGVCWISSSHEKPLNTSSTPQSAWCSLRQIWINMCWIIIITAGDDQWRFLLIFSFNAAKKSAKHSVAIRFWPIHLVGHAMDNFNDRHLHVSFKIIFNTLPRGFQYKSVLMP